MDNNDLTSSFIPTAAASVSAEFTDLQEVPSSGFNRMVRAKRYGRWWMLKCLKSEYQSQSVYQLLLQKEYDLMSQLAHQGVAMVNSLEQVDGLGLTIVMEWIEGATLSSWIESGQSQKMRMQIALQLIDALSYIHGKQIVHRDLKPQNIMIATNGQTLKIIDFGLSDADSYALLKQAAGSDGYISPEQRAGGKPDIRNDIYSLGRILSDLKLGFMSRFVVKRCIAPIDMRYNNAAEVKQALLRGYRLPSRIAAICLVAGIIVGGALWHYGVQTEPVSAAADTAVIAPASDEKPSKQEAPDGEKMHLVRETVITTKPSDYERDRKIIDKAVASGKQLFDTKLAQTDKEIKQQIDTLTYVCYIEQQLVSTVHAMANDISGYAAKFDSQLNSVYSSTEIENTLLEYVNNNYYRRWIALIEQRSLPQRPQ